MSRVKIVALSRTIVNSRAISSSNGDESAMKRSCQAMSSLLFFFSFSNASIFSFFFLSFYFFFFIPYSIRREENYFDIFPEFSEI